MSSPIRTTSTEGSGTESVVELSGLSTDELRLVASFIDVVRSWRSARNVEADEFQVLWQRMKAKATDTLNDDEVMGIALEAQGTVRRARV